MLYICSPFRKGSDDNTVAGVLKLVDKPDLGSGAVRRMGSIPFARTQKWFSNLLNYFCFQAGSSTPVSYADDGNVMRHDGKYGRL